MDATTQALVTELVAASNANRGVYWLLFFVVTFLGSFLGAYLKKKGENRALREDFDELKRQLRENTRVTEGIKSEFGHAEWRAREFNSVKRAALEKLVRTSGVALDTSFEAVRDKVLGGESDKSVSEALLEIEMLTSMYFPELEAPSSAYVRAQRLFMGWGYSECSQLTGMPEDERQLRIDANQGELNMRYRAVLELRLRLGSAAVVVMQGLLKPAGDAKTQQ